MELKTIERCIDVANTFIGKAMLAKVELTGKGDGRYHSGTPISGALRRASMELTRALADLRQGR